MAHELEIINGNACTFTVGDKPWHGLGKNIQKAPTIEEGIIKAGLDWNVMKTQLFYKDKYGITTHTKEYRSLIRETDGKFLGIVGKDYEPLQNIEAFNWFDFLLDNGNATLESAGSLKGGKRIWVLAKLKNEAEIVSNDQVNSYVLLSNSHDGSTAVWLQFTPIRVVCWNTLSAALSRRNDMDNTALRLSHTSNLQKRLELAKDVVDLSNQRFTTYVDDYRTMASRQCNSEKFERYAGLVLQNDKPKETRAWDVLERFFEAGSGNELSGVRGTYWGAFNSFTQWVDHSRGRDNNRLFSTWFGDGKRLRERAYKLALVAN